MTTENIAVCRKWIFACAMTMNAVWCCAAEPFALSYRQPARNWFEAMPIGNGRLGAMAFGGVESDCLVLNEDTIWTGRPLGCGNEPITPAMLKKSRELLFAGEIVKGNAASKSRRTVVWRSRSTPTSVPSPVSRKCSCSRIAAESTCCRLCRRSGRSRVRSRASARAAAGWWTANGRTASR